MLDRRARLAGIRCIEAALSKMASEGGMLTPPIPMLQKKPNGAAVTPTATESMPKILTPPTT